MELFEMILNEELLNNGVNAISLVGSPAIESNFIAMSKTNIQLAEVDKEKRILIGAVLIPDKPILRNDDHNINGGNPFNIFFTKETVRKVMENYHINLRNNNTTLEHSGSVPNITVIESWIKEDEQKDKSALFNLSDPVGTWYVTMKVNNEDIWTEFVKTGNVKGFSIEGFFNPKKTALTTHEQKLEAIKNIINEFENSTNT